MELSISPITDENSVEIGAVISISLRSKEAVADADLHWILETSGGDFRHERTVSFVGNPHVPGAISHFKIPVPDFPGDTLSVRAGIGTPLEVEHEVSIVAQNRP